ncbi:hypothetical protein K6U27_10985, partial [Vibrio fluvialis]|nr:hypothetical protein [Vibrio fluvialis]
MKNHLLSSAKNLCLTLSLIGASSFAWAGHHLSVKGTDQDVSGGTVTAHMIMAAAHAWISPFLAPDPNNPPPASAHSPVRQCPTGSNQAVSATLPSN